MKKFFFFSALVLCTTALFATDIEATIEITNVQPKTGTLFVAVFDSQEALKKNNPITGLKLETNGNTITALVTLPAGEYYVSAYQDLNNNGKLDTNFIGIPKEPVGIANYSGSGIPGGFDKHKVLINAENPKVTLGMNKI